MESFSDIFTDAFPETSVPSFPEGDLDFVNLNFDEKCEVDETKNSTTKKDEALLQEATGETAVLFGTEAKDVLYTAEDVHEEQTDDRSDEEDFKIVGVMDKTQEEDCINSGGDSEEEGCVSGEADEDEDEDVGTAEKPGDLFTSVLCSNEFPDGQPLASQGAENPQVRNKEQSEGERDEEVAYFERVPERGNKMVTQGAGTEEDEQEREEEKQEDSSDPECEGMKTEQEENVLTLCSDQEVENSYGDDPETASSEFPCISLQNLQVLTSEDDSEEYEEKMKDFSGDEHQEAGEHFADYPSDFSSCEYVEDGLRTQGSNSDASPCTSECSSYAQQSTCLERAVTDITWLGSAEDTDTKDDECLYSRDLEMDADALMSLDVAAGEQDRGNPQIVSHLVVNAAVTVHNDGDEAGESDSYSSSDEEFYVRKSNEDLFDMCPHDLENNKQLEDTQLYGDSRSSSDDHRITNRVDTADFLSWEFDVLKTDTLQFDYPLTTDGNDKAGMPPPDVNQRPAEDVNSYTVVQREDPKTTSPSYLGSLDDSFFNTELEASEITELGALADDENEEERNWEQEQERIKAFYEFYDDSNEEDGREGRQIKVQFCDDLLSQVIHYDTDSSDRDSLSSSTDREEDQSSAEMSDELKEPDDTLQMKPCDPPNTQPPENVPNLSNTQTCTGKHKCPNMLKLILKIGLVTMTGLLMFWLTTDQADWLSQVFFF
ncbi:protein starmaker-like isoform X1 [Brachyistius frenatus]|uniref:protein starmaker-like isoform X1 n=1 Tax=Brachyistius frenatus TaxID=100188 RepID=UPI0037E77164